MRRPVGGTWFVVADQQILPGFCRHFDLDDSALSCMRQRHSCSTTPWSDADPEDINSHCRLRTPKSETAVHHDEGHDHPQAWLGRVVGKPSRVAVIHGTWDDNVDVHGHDAEIFAPGDNLNVCPRSKTNPNRSPSAP